MIEKRDTATIVRYLRRLADSASESMDEIEKTVVSGRQHEVVSILQEAAARLERLDKSQAGTRDFNPLAPFEELPEDIREDIKTERGHVTRLRIRRP